MSAKAEKKVVDINAALAAAETKTPVAGKKESKYPVIDFDTETVDRLIANQEELDSIAAEIAVDKADLLEIVGVERGNLCKKGYVNTVKVPGSSREISISWANSYNGTITAKKTEKIVDIIGDDKFEKFFDEKLEIELVDTSIDALETVITALGAETFAKFFSVKRSFKPGRNYTDEFFTSFSDDERDELKEVVVQRAPSVRLK